MQTAILQNLRQSLGAAATLPEEAAKDLILQVNLISLSIMSTITIQFVLTFLVIIYFLFFLQEIHRIQMGCKLQEVAAKYQYEGFSRIDIACAGTDTQKLIDLLETMFGEMDIEDIDLSKMETETTRDLRKEAEVAEAASTAAETGITSKDKITRVYVTSLPVPLEFGIPSQNLPETESIKERSTKNAAKKVTKFYYTCHLCPHSSQNKSR